MASISGRMTIVGVDLDEYNSLLSQIASLPQDYTLVSKDDPSFTVTVDVNAQV